MVLQCGLKGCTEVSSRKARGVLAHRWAREYLGGGLDKDRCAPPRAPRLVPFCKVCNARLSNDCLDLVVSSLRVLKKEHELLRLLSMGGVVDSNGCEGDGVFSFF